MVSNFELVSCGENPLSETAQGLQKFSQQQEVLVWIEGEVGGVAQ